MKVYKPVIESYAKRWKSTIK